MNYRKGFKLVLICLGIFLLAISLTCNIFIELQIGENMVFAGVATFIVGSIYIFFGRSIND